jgi:hypothetical protein
MRLSQGPASRQLLAQHRCPACSGKAGLRKDPGAQALTDADNLGGVPLTARRRWDVAPVQFLCRLARRHVSKLSKGGPQLLGKIRGCLLIGDASGIQATQLDATSLGGKPAHLWCGD